MRTFTKKELAEFNGRNGKPTYVAVNGKVYDVTKSEQWEDGEHQYMHNAGQDQSDAISDAPHDPDVLERYPVVGALTNE
ncbi:MAG: cytochrome b5 domain-containing protein [Methanomassiliicoccales archaeon]